jgi:cytochrome b subunit of formate dehydrogenase
MQEEVQTVIVSRETASESAVPAAEKPQAAWSRWVLPSFADVFFLVLAGILAFGPASSALLNDADTGWHIRNGEIILATHAVPRTDSFSYTRAGQPWYSWEWLYDTVIAAVHHLAGLNGVVLFTAVIIAATFALLFQFVLRRSGSFVVAVALTLLAAAAAQVHMLARPHVLSWLFTLLWVEALYRFEEGKRSALLWLPPLMLLWVNVHGGFILGLVLLALFGCAHIWNALTVPSEGDRQKIVALATAFCVCLAVTLLTPYGYKLHVHVFQYLSNSFLMDSIAEFLSPNFHGAAYRYFEMFILLAILGGALGRVRLATTDLLLLLFSIHAGLFSARNIPLAAILMSLAMAPLWAGIVLRGAEPGTRPRWLGSLLEIANDISRSMAGMERQFRGHALAIVALAAGTAIALNGGRVFSAQIMSARFNDKTLPVKAAEFIAQRGIHDHLFNSDGWSGYLIYRLYPGTKVFFDDRHDFYGEAFIKDYLKTANAGWQWQESLEKYQVKWVLIATDSPLAGVLKQSRDWRAEYDDGLAIVFARISH